MDWLAQCARIIGKSGYSVRWTTPMGLPVVQPYKKETGDRQRIETVVHKMLLYPKDKLPINTNRQRSAFPPNFIHSLDSSHMMYTSIDCAKAGVTYASVHDSYWTHAATVEPMSRILRENFIKLHKQPIMERLLEEWRTLYPDISEFPPLPKRGDLDLDKVAKSRYFFN